MWIALGALALVGFFVGARRASESRTSDQLPDGKTGSGSKTESLEDSIDWDELRKAEDEVRGIDPMAQPEDGFEGDDWGPGRPPKPPLA